MSQVRYKKGNNDSKGGENDSTGNPRDKPMVRSHVLAAYKQYEKKSYDFCYQNVI